MNVLTLQSTYGGLLHDTGKAVYRAGGQCGSHSEQGYQFLHGVLTGCRLGTQRWTVCATTTPPRCASVQQQALPKPIPRPISFIWRMIFPPPQTAGRSKAKAAPSGGTCRWTRCSLT